MGIRSIGSARSVSVTRIALSITTPLVSKAELLAKLTPDELTDLYTKKSSDVEVEIFWDQLNNQRVVDLVKNPALQNAGVLTQERLEEIISI